MQNYTVGSEIEYRLAGGDIRRVRVIARMDDVKDGRPGFDGEEANGAMAWGYDEQIVRVVR